MYIKHHQCTRATHLKVRDRSVTVPQLLLPQESKFCLRESDDSRETAAAMQASLKQLAVGSSNLLA